MTASPSISTGRSRASRSRAARAADIQVVLGSNTFLPGLRGAAPWRRGRRQAGHSRDLPRSLRRALARRPDRRLRRDGEGGGAAREPLAIDDEFAKGLGFESLDRLKEMIRERIASDYARASRDKLKRQLLDKLDALYSFELPEGLGQPGVRFDLGAGDARAAGLRPQLRRREHHGGGRPRRLPQDRRAPGASRPPAGRSRDQGGRQSLGRRDDPGA